MIVAVPIFDAETTPLVDTDATPSSELDQPTVRPVSSFPAASMAWAVSCSVCPEFNACVLGVMVSLDIAAGETDTTAVSAALPLAAAMTFALPGFTAVATPVAVTLT